MATKVKPSRLQVSWTPQAWCVPVYVNEDCFCWWAWGGGWCSEWWCITWTLCDQTDLQWALDCKQDKACMVCNLTSPDDSHYPTAKAVADAMACAGTWDMLKSVYDPNNIEADVYDYCNFTNTPTIPTDNRQLSNGCWYTTCTGTVVASDLTNLAQCCDIPTNNNQLTNWCGYTTCTGTVSTCADVISALGYTPYSTGNPCNYINSFAGVISALWYTPYNTTNPCGYTTCTGTVSTCADVIWALWYTPYNSTNPCWYTTCTGTVVASDISWLVAESCIACINWCCLTQWGDICIQWGGGGFDKTPYTQAEYDQLEIDNPSVLTDCTWRLIYE